MKTKNLKEYTNVGSLYVSKELLKFVNNEVLKGTKIKPKNFWSGFEKSLHILKPKNEKLIDIRESIQKKIDDWHIQNKDNEFNLAAYKKFLYSINYLKKEGKNFKIQTENVDEEISKTPGPQLVVPISNSAASFGAQLYGIIAINVFVFVVSFIIWYIMKMLFGIRISEEAEKLGTDKSEVGVMAYSIRD